MCLHENISWCIICTNFHSHVSREVKTLCNKQQNKSFKCTSFSVLFSADTRNSKINEIPRRFLGRTVVVVVVVVVFLLFSADFSILMVPRRFTLANLIIVD